MHEPYQRSGGVPFLALACLGVVYGDIGTSPLYALRECFFGEYAVAPTAANVLGVLSLITWSLLLVISLKYLVFVLRADNDGEGGILALMELVRRATRGRLHKLVLGVGMFGAALLYGDGMITPALSVLSAVEGLKVATPVFEPYVVPLTVVVLLALFLVQGFGTSRVGGMFGPIMLVWFGTLAVAGSAAVIEHPAVLTAVDPRHALAFFGEHGWHALTVLGIVFLVVTGGEALYADIGHFGKLPIRLSWYAVVLPGLLLNYFGQGALILTRPEGLTNPFYQLVPASALYPMVVLATAATVIASQAIISGAFSLTFQATQLNYLPRVKIRHTSAGHRGQIYVPAVNWLLLAASVALVLGFRESGNLVAAYGIAISATMLITGLLFCIAARYTFGWKAAVVVGLAALFLVMDLAFVAATLGKFFDGGWFPILVAGGVYLLMSIWRRGRRVHAQMAHDIGKPVRTFLAEQGGSLYRRVPGQAVYLSHSEHGTPHVLVHNLRHNRALHNRVVIYTARFLREPYASGERLKVRRLRDDVHRVVARYGFMEAADVPRDLELASREYGLDLDLDKISYFVGGELLLAEEDFGLPRWQARLYVLMARNQRVTRFGLPRDRVFEIGTEVTV